MKRQGKEVGVVSDSSPFLPLLGTVEKFSERLLHRDPLENGHIFGLCERRVEKWRRLDDIEFKCSD